MNGHSQNTTTSASAITAKMSVTTSPGFQYQTPPMPARQATRIAYGPTIDFQCGWMCMTTLSLLVSSFSGKPTPTSLGLLHLSAHDGSGDRHAAVSPERSAF